MHLHPSTLILPACLLHCCHQFAQQRRLTLCQSHYNEKLAMLSQASALPAPAHAEGEGGSGSLAQFILSSNALLSCQVRPWGTFVLLVEQLNLSQLGCAGLFSSAVEVVVCSFTVFFKNSFTVFLKNNFSCYIKSSSIQFVQLKLCECLFPASSGFLPAFRFQTSSHRKLQCSIRFGVYRKSSRVQEFEGIPRIVGDDKLQGVLDVFEDFLCRAPWLRWIRVQSGTWESGSLGPGIVSTVIMDYAHGDWDSWLGLLPHSCSNSESSPLTTCLTSDLWWHDFQFSPLSLLTLPWGHSNLQLQVP